MWGSSCSNRAPQTVQVRAVLAKSSKFIGKNPSVESLLDRGTAAEELHAFRAVKICAKVACGAARSLPRHLTGYRLMALRDPRGDAHKRQPCVSIFDTFERLSKLQ
jgi:hypothetical protein